MTNGDWIRSMNDEELATWLHNICHYEYGKDDAPYVSVMNMNDKDVELHDSHGDLLNWLIRETP